MTIKCDENYTNFDLPLGWLSPTGEFVNCEIYNHFSTAEEIINKYNYSGLGTVDDILIAFGWVHITMSLMGKKGYEVFWNTERHLSSEQFSFLQKYFEYRDNVGWFSQVRWDKECDTR